MSLGLPSACNRDALHWGLVLLNTHSRLVSHPLHLSHLLQLRHGATPTATWRRHASSDPIRTSLPVRSSLHYNHLRLAIRSFLHQYHLLILRGTGACTPNHDTLTPHHLTQLHLLTSILLLQRLSAAIRYDHGGGCIIFSHLTASTAPEHTDYRGDAENAAAN